jgi:hypothetical protein
VRPTTSVTSLLVTGAASAVLLAMAPAAGAARPDDARLTDRLTSVVQTTEAPYGDPVPITVVLVSGTITGCTPASTSPRS